MSKPTYEELAAQVEVLRQAVCKYPTVEIPLVYDALFTQTPAACLAQVRANAIDAAVDFEDGRYCETVSDRIDMILDYANSIRQGGDV